MRLPVGLMSKAAPAPRHPWLSLTASAPSHARCRSPLRPAYAMEVMCARLRGAHAAGARRSRRRAADAAECALHFCAARGCIRCAHLDWSTKSKDNSMTHMHDYAWKLLQTEGHAADGEPPLLLPSARA